MERVLRNSRCSFIQSVGGVKVSLSFWPYPLLEEKKRKNKQGNVSKVSISIQAYHCLLSWVVQATIPSDAHKQTQMPNPGRHVCASVTYLSLWIAVDGQEQRETSKLSAENGKNTHRCSLEKLIVRVAVITTVRETDVALKNSHLLGKTAVRTHGCSVTNKIKVSSLYLRTSEWFWLLLLDVCEWRDEN